MNTYAQSMLDYINGSPTPYHAVNNLKDMLEKKNAIRLDVKSSWDLEQGKLFYVVNKDTSIAAFYLSSDLEKGFKIAAAHTDSPCFRIKPASSFIKGGYELLNVEGYGGSILYSWLDRPLGLAGVVYVKENDSIRKAYINISEPIAIIPSLAIHMNRDVNENVKFNIQTELSPLFAQEDSRQAFICLLAKEANCTEEDVLSFDLMTYDASPGTFVGLNKEFVSSPRLDDLSMVNSIFTRFVESCDNMAENAIAVAFDHEECGSLSDRGARSNFIDMILDRIFESFEMSKEKKYIALSKSFLISGDMAHAAHPAYPEKNDPHMQVSLNKGPVLKHNSNQSYASNAKATAYIKTICNKNDIPLQEYANRSDIRGGGTIGPMLSAEYGITAVDIGNPMLSMHSARELGGSKDPIMIHNLFKVFYSNN